MATQKPKFLHEITQAPDGFDLSTAKPAETSLLRRAGDVGLGLLQGAIAVPEAAVGLADIATGGRAGKTLEGFGFRPKEAKAILDDFKSDAAKDAQYKFQQAEGFTGKTAAALQNPSVITDALAQSAAPMLAGGAVGRGINALAPAAAGRLGAGAIGEGVIGAGSAASQIRGETQDGLLTGQQAALAGLSGAATMGLGMAGRKLAGKLNVGDIDEAIATGKMAGKSGGPGVLGGMARGTLAEGVFEELPQSLSEQAIQNVALGRNVTEDLDAAATLGLLSGGVMGSGMGGVSGWQNRRTPREPAQETSAPAQPSPEQQGQTSAAQAPEDDQAKPMTLGFSPFAGTPVVFPDGSVALGSEQEQAMRDQRAAQNHPGFPAKGMTAEEAMQAAQSNVALFAQRQQPRQAGDTFDMLATAKEQGYDFAPVIHPSGNGFLIVPRDRVTPDMVRSAEQVLNETIARMRQADEAPVQRAERRKSDGVELNVSADPVGAYVDQLRATNTPAARAFVGEFDAGRITRQDVERRMQAERGKTPDEIIAEAAATAQPATQGGIIMPERLSQRMGLNPNAGTLSRAAVVAVDSGASPATLGAAANGIEATQAVQAEAQGQEAPAAGTAAAGVTRPTNNVRRANLARLKERMLAGRNANAQARTTDAAIGQATDSAAPPALAQQQGAAQGLGIAEPDMPAAGTEQQGALTNEQDQAPTAAGVADTQTQADQAAAAEGGGYPIEATGLPAAGGAGGVRADGVGQSVQWNGKQMQMGEAKAGLETFRAMVADTEKTIGELSRSKKKGDPERARLMREKLDSRRALVSRMEQAIADAEFVAARNLSKNPEKTDTSAERVQKSAESEQVGPFEHAGLKIRQSRVKAGESIESRWIVQSPENAEREKRGERQIGGDRIVDSREKAIKAAEEMVAEAKRDADRRAAAEAAEKAERDAAEAKKAANRGKSIVERRNEAILDKIVRDSETGQVSSRREWVERKVAAGLKTTVTQEDKIKPMSRAQFNRADNRQQAEHERKVKEAGKKDVYWLGDFEVTKAEYEYANKISAAPKAETKEAEKAPASPAGTAGNAQAPVATHKDPGEKAETATKAVVSEAMQTAAENQDTKPSEMRKWLLTEIDKALLQAPDRADYDEAVKRMGEKDAVSMFTGNGFLGKNAETGFVTFDVPGDGKFKVRNSTRGLLEFRKNVSASLGFKDSGQKTVKPEQNEGVRSGSGGQMAAIINMIEEGDFEAARDYAEAVGISLDDVKVPKGERKPQWDRFRKDGTLPQEKRLNQGWVITSEPHQKTAYRLAKVARLNWTSGGSDYVATVVGDTDGTGATYEITKDGGKFSALTTRVSFTKAMEMAESAVPADANNQPESKPKTEKLAAPEKMTSRQFGEWIREQATRQTDQFAGDRFHGGGDEGVGYIHLSGKIESGGLNWAGAAKDAKDNRDSRLVFRTDENKLVWFDDGTQQAYEVAKDDPRLEITRPEKQAKAERNPQEVTVEADGSEHTVTFEQPLATIDDQTFEDNLIEYGTPGVAKAEFRKLRAQAQAGGAATPTATGTRRDPAKVSMFNPYEDGDIVTIDGQDWTVKQDTPGWYLTNTGNWRGTHPTIRNIKAMTDLIRAVEQAAVALPKADEPEAKTQRLTPAEAAELMEWQLLGTKDGVTKHILTFYESKADKDAKRGRMVLATVTKGDRSASNWMVDGDDQAFGVLGMAKKKAMEVGMARAIADGYVEQAQPTPQPAQQAHSPFAAYNEIASQYGYEVSPDGLVGLKGKPGKVKMVTKGIRLRMESEGGNLLASYPAKPESLEKFLKEFWFAEKKAKPAQQAAEAPAKPAAPASKTPTVDAHEALMNSVREGKATAEQFKAGFASLVQNKTAAIAELETKTKAELLKAGGYYFQTRNANEKKADVAEALYREMLDEYSLGEGYSYGMGKNAKEDAIRRIVEATDADKLAQFAKDREQAIAEAKAERAARAAALENPQTLDDFRNLLNSHIRQGKTRKEAFLMLTPEQRTKYDALEAESTKEAREARKRAQKTTVQAAGQTTGGQIIATKHTRDGYDLFVVQLSDRLSREDYTTVLNSAKKLGGWYSSFRGNGATPGFQFKDKANAEAFLKLAGGDTTDAQAQAEQRRDAFEDDRSQTAAERLNEMADRMEEAADESLSRDRKANTERRARFAQAAEREAQQQKAMAKTMRNIAAALESGTAKFLDAVRTKTQVEMLASTVRTAQDNELRAKYPSYAEQEKRKGQPPTAETADFAEFPSYTAYRSDLASLARQMLEVDGTKKLGQSLMKVADDVTDAYLDFAKANLGKVSQFVRGGDMAVFASRDDAERAIKRSGLVGKAIVLPVKRGDNRIILSPSEAINRQVWTGDGDKRITLTAEFGAELVEAIGRRGNKTNGLTVPWQFQNAYDRRKALSRMGIETPSEFRSALREFIGLQEQAMQNKVRELELKMVGRKADGLDFFPTPAEVADQMIEAAEIEAGMRVLEPSAGMGHIADRIRATGAEPDVVEMSGERRELLQEKGYNVVAGDFTEFTAPAERGFTFGDLMRAPDGTVGVLRGQGGMGSDRVRLVSDEAEPRELGKYNFSELEGVERRGVDSGYDRIIMNPPFSDRRDAQHVQHAYTLLKPGGRIVAIMGEGVFFGQDKKAQDFREWLDQVGGTSEKLPPGSFMDPSLPVNTGVNARMVVIDKPAGTGAQGDAPMFSRETAEAAPPPFYSALSREVEALPTKAAPAVGWQMALQGLVKNGKVKSDELEWTGITDWLKLQTGKVTKEQVTAYLDANGVQVTEVVLGAVDVAAQERQKYARMSDADVAEEWAAMTGRNDKAGMTRQGMIDEMVESAVDYYSANQGDDGGTKYSQYTLPGGTNYREVLLTLPVKGSRDSSPLKWEEATEMMLLAQMPSGNIITILFDETGAAQMQTMTPDAIDIGKPKDFASVQEAKDAAQEMVSSRSQDIKDTYRSSHWDQPNVLAHIRVNDRVDADGKRVLFVEEIQSDWGQDGKKRGFSGRQTPLKATNQGGMQWEVVNEETGDFVGNYMAHSEGEAISYARADSDSPVATDGVPRAPFVDKTDKWLALSLKRIMKMAADGGYDRVAFVNGEQSAERYDLSKQIQSVRLVTDDKDGTLNRAVFNAIQLETGQAINRIVNSERDLEDVIGKDLARKLLETKPVKSPGGGWAREISGLDLKVGGEGMKAFYDKIVPAAIKDVLKKVGGGQMEAAQIGALTQPGFTITPAMREKIANGMPLFQRPATARRGVPIDRAQSIVDGIKARWANAPEVVVVNSMRDPKVPERVQRADAEMRKSGATGTPKGFWFQGKAYVVASAVRNDADVATVLFHEVLGHYGLRGVFGDSLKPILQQVATMRKAQMQAKAKEYGLNLANERDRLTAAEEILAVMAQETPQIGFVQRAIAAIRTWLRKHVPGFQGMALTDAEIIANYILPARAFVERGPGGGPDGGVSFARTTGEVAEAMPPTIEVDGKQRPTTNSNGKPIHPTEEGVRNFYRWFGDSKAVDAEGKPLVVYHGTSATTIEAFDDAFAGSSMASGSGLDGFYFTADPETAGLYAKASEKSQHQMYGRFYNRQNILPVFLSMQNPLVYKKQRGDQITLMDTVKRRVISEAKQAGHDGVIFQGFRDTPTGRGANVADVYVAFNPTQIKSATGNTGAFDPQNADIRFSRAAEAEAREPRMFDVRGKTADTLAHYRGMALQALGRRQLVDLYADMLPQLNDYNELVQRMDADKNEAGAEADEMVRAWAKLDKASGRIGEEKRLADLMHDATLAQMDPAKDFVPGDNKEKYDELRARWDAISPQAKELYTTARDMYMAHFDKVREALDEKIQRTAVSESIKAKMMARMEKELYGKLKGVYFPLARFGQYVVVTRKPDGSVASVSRAETLAEARAMQAEMIKAFPPKDGFTVSKIHKSAEYNATRDLADKGFMADLMEMLRSQGADDSMLDAVGQLYLSSLPDLSWAKHGLHRKGMPGFSQDARRAFAQNMFHGARYLAKLRYGDQMTQSLMDMQEHVKAYKDIEEYDEVKAQQVLDEMQKRHELLMNPPSHPVSTALTSLGFVWFMGLSPASALVNLSQTALVAYPVMGARWGFAKAGRALAEASALTVKAGNDLSKVLKGDELEAFEKAAADGTIDVTQAHDLAGIAQGEDQRVTWAMRPVMRAASFMFHHAEKFNRQATFIAAYRLAKAAGADNESAFNQAKKATYDGHYDYSASNRPRLMQGNWQRVLFLFKQYGQNMVYSLTRNAYLSMKGMTPAERKEARKALGGILSLHAAAAGVLGLPLVGPLLAAASFLGSDDDEPWDAEVAMRNAMADTLGKDAAEVIARGFSRLTPFDISGRVALNKLILPDVQEGLEGQRLGEAWATAMLGPVPGIGMGFLKGMQEIGEGRYGRALEEMVPVALKGPLKAFRFNEEGAQDRTGVTIKDDVSLTGEVGQFLGLAPSEVRLATEGRQAIYAYDRALLERRQTLMRMFAQAQMGGDTEMAKEVLTQIKRYNQKNPDRIITMPQLMQSVRSRSRRINEAKNGVYLPRNRQGAMSAGAFAIDDDEDE